MMVYDLTKEA